MSNTHERPSLESRLDRRLQVSAAMAAALGSLVAIPESNAGIIYTAVGKAVAYGTSFGFDINADGAFDFFLNNHYAGSEFVTLSGGGFGGFSVGNGLYSTYMGFGYYTDNLSKGATIAFGTTSFYTPTVLYHDPAVGPGYGEFSTAGGGPEIGKATGNYIGVAFVSTSYTLHTGWIGIDLTGATPTITGFAWETTPSMGITAGAGAAVPEPASASLAALALGATGLAHWRRRRSDAAPSA